MNLDNYIGQDRIKPVVSAELAHCNAHGLPFPHTILHGPPGTGKSELAQIIAEESQAPLLRYDVDKSMTASRLQHILLSLPIDGYDKQGRRGADGRRYVLFFDEVHCLPQGAYEALYTPLQDREIHVGGQVSWLPMFSFVGATTDLSMLPPALLSRMGLTLELEPYAEEQLARIIVGRYAGVDETCAMSIAARARGSARIALNYAERVLHMGGDSARYFDAVGVDAVGMTALDRRYMDALQAAGRPMSGRALAAASGMPLKTLETVVEPYLLRRGLVTIGPQGRIPLQPGRGRLVKASDN